MRTLILSDIHSNDMALKAILSHAFENHDPQEIWFLGDLVGYGPEPYAAWRRLQGEQIADNCWLAGNHDWGLTGKLDGPSTFFADANEGNEGIEISNFRGVAWEILRFQQETLEDKMSLLSHLASRPVASRPRPGVYLAHGTFATNARDVVTRYDYTPTLPPSQLVANMQALAEAQPEDCFLAPEPAGTSPRLFAFGHTHHSGIWRWQPEGQRWQHCAALDRHYFDDETRPYYLNPGSVGFPRDGSGCPTYAIVDWEVGRLHLERVRYDVAAVRRQMAVYPYELLLSDNGVLIEPRC